MSNQEMTTTNEDMMRIASNVADQAKGDLGMMPMLKFKKTEYFLDGEPVPLGTTYLVYCPEWVKTWVHFEDKVPVERRVYRASKREIVPERHELPDNDQTKWERFGPEGKPKDPWVLQYLVPMEDLQSGAQCIFVAQSFGARRAVSELCNTWAGRVRRDHIASNPIVEIRTGTFRSKNWGQVMRPVLNIVNWEEGGAVEGNGGTAYVKPPPRVEIEALALKEDDMNDEIPF